MRFERGFLLFVQGVTCVAAFTISSCTDGASSGERVVARSTVVAGVIPPHGTGASVEERFGLQPSAARPDAGVSEAARMLRWDLPAGWVERAPSSMRIANFLAAGDPEAECYLTILAGDAGGLGANVNRWLAQMGRAALGSAQMDALPHTRLFDRDAVLLEADGDFTGMGGEARSAQRLIGILLVDPNGSAFFKLVGPADVVARERDAFLALARSLRSSSEGQASSTPSATRSERAGGLVAQVPSEWARLPEKPPRALDLRVEAKVECSITVLAGSAGGARANIDRWRSQLGLAPLDDTQFLGLEHVPLLDGRAYLVEASTTDSAVLGAAYVADDRSVFVKMTGPVGQLARHRTEFLELCRTLEDG
jgi:hypothetical protein